MLPYKTPLSAAGPTAYHFFLTRSHSQYSATSSVQAVYGVLNWKFFGCYTYAIGKESEGIFRFNDLLFPRFRNEITYSLAIEVDVVKNLDSCQAYCSGRSYAYFGVQGDDQKCCKVVPKFLASKLSETFLTTLSKCFFFVVCGGSLDATPGMPTPTRYCNVVCSGNSTQFCGGKGTLSVYQNPVNSNPYGPPTGKDIISKQLSSPWKSLGCYR